MIYFGIMSLVFIINIGGFPVDFGEADRFVSVMVPFLLILFFKALEIFLVKQTPVRQMVILFLIGCWTCYPLARTIRNAVQWHETVHTNR
jgi:hypothetical protein